MPVSDVARLRALSQQISAAGKSQDWERLRQLDSLLAQWIELPPAVLPDDAEVHSVWRELMESHIQARKACQQSLQEVSAQLRGLQNQSEAHKAYAWQEQF
jgi:hypothetical protein